MLRRLLEDLFAYADEGLVRGGCGDEGSQTLKSRIKRRLAAVDILLSTECGRLGLTLGEAAVGGSADGSRLRAG